MAKKIVGSGKGYSIRTYKKAINSGAAIRTTRGTAGSNRKMFRDNLFDWVLDEKACDEKAGTITDPRSLNPYRGKSYGSAVEALFTHLPDVSNLVGHLSKDRTSVLKWVDENNSTTAITTSWIDGRQLFQEACRIEPQLKTSLKNRRSNRKNVQKRITNLFDKFVEYGVKTIQRTGGTAPPGYPLLRSKFAIDSRFVADGNNQPKIQFRLAVGRGEPQRSGLNEFKRSRKLTKSKSKVRAA